MPKTAMALPIKQRKNKLVFFFQEFFYFGIRQAQASLFAGSMMAAIIVTKLCWQPEFTIARYDFLFVYALVIQCLFIALKLERFEEVKVIFLFHLVGTIMEIFKTQIGSWSYPEENLIRIGGVPLFSGFMYSAVGSYIARVWRIFDFRFEHFPSTWAMSVLSLLIYLNFFTHHYIYDIRYILFACAAVLFARTKVYYKPRTQHYWMPLLFGFVLVSFFIWIAENVGTFGAIWLYPNQQNAWHIVSFAKMGSWFLLMIISFVLVSLLHKKEKM